MLVPVLPSSQVASPLERFVVDYVETVGGVSEGIEPQVYDLLLPPSEANQAEELRIAFDSEALPEHPGAQLASYGTPLVDRLLRDALARGRFAELFLTGLNLQPYGVEELAARSLQVPPGFQLAVFRRRSLLFLSASHLLVSSDIHQRSEGARGAAAGNRPALWAASPASRPIARGGRPRGRTRRVVARDPRHDS
jgi:hypothetical protein